MSSVTVRSYTIAESGYQKCSIINLLAKKETVLEKGIRKTFSSLSIRNFRLFIIGQAISLCGTWMQTIAISWLVLQLSHSGTILGLAIAAQFVPVLLFGVWGGVIADRFNKRRVLFITQSIFGVLALTLGILVLSHNIDLLEVFIIAVLIGLVQVVDNPTRQSFVVEMVGTEQVRNAVTLNSTMVNVARVIGPSFGGILIATVGVGTCFIVNAFTFVAVLIALFLMHVSELRTTRPAKREPGQLKAGFKYVLSEPNLKVTLIMMFIIGTFAYEFPVVFPLFATHVLHGNASTYSSMMVATGIGAVLGGLYAAGHTPRTENPLILIAFIFGVSILLAAFMPTHLLVLVFLVLVGALSVLFIAIGNTTLQLTSTQEMRGRVMALWTVAFLGTTPVGGPIIGFISDHTNPRIGLAVGGISAVIAAIIAKTMYKPSSHSNEQPRTI
ncbi:MAG: MFS transporter [Candidatus Saccharibacteria bacterium]